MRIPNRLSYKRWIRYEMIFFLGMILGALIFLLFYGKEIDRLNLSLKALENENNALTEQIRKWEEQDKNKNVKKLIVKDVEIHLDHQLDDITEADLIKILEKDTKFLEGKSLDSVNDLHQMIQQYFKGREYKIGDRLIRTELKMISIYQTIHLYISAKASQPTP